MKHLFWIFLFFCAISCVDETLNKLLSRSSKVSVVHKIPIKQSDYGNIRSTNATKSSTAKPSKKKGGFFLQSQDFKSTHSKGVKLREIDCEKADFDDAGMTFVAQIMIDNETVTAEPIEVEPGCSSLSVTLDNLSSDEKHDFHFRIFASLPDYEPKCFKQCIQRFQVSSDSEEGDIFNAAPECKLCRKNNVGASGFGLCLDGECDDNNGDGFADCEAPPSVPSDLPTQTLGQGGEAGNAGNAGSSGNVANHFPECQNSALCDQRLPEREVEGAYRATPYSTEQHGRGTCSEDLSRISPDTRQWAAVSEKFLNESNIEGWTGCGAGYVGPEGDYPPQCARNTNKDAVCGKPVWVRCTDTEKCADNSFHQVYIVDVCPGDRTYHDKYDPNSKGDYACRDKNIADLDTSLLEEICNDGYRSDEFGCANADIELRTTPP